MSLVNEPIQHYIMSNCCLNRKNYVDIAKDVNMEVGKLQGVTALSFVRDVDS
jgi:hypothetical protein